MKRFLALGDSYTIGECVAENERWPVQLVYRLWEQGIKVRHPHIIAVTGWTTAELAAGIAANQPEGPFDFVSLLIGVNDQYDGISLAEYETEFVALLNEAVDFAGGRRERVVVLSIPDWSVVPFAADRDRAKIVAEIEQFNSVNKIAAAEAGVSYVDVTTISRQAAMDSRLTAGDGLHPSGAMYALWVSQLLPLAQEILVG